jgi:hypothetical protein
MSAVKAKAYKDLPKIERQLDDALNVIHAALAPQIEDGNALDDALVFVAAYCDVARRVMRKTNPSRIASEARTAEIHARIDGAMEAV